MPCACGSGGAKKTVYTWTSADGKKKVEKYSKTEVEYLVSKRGGSYVSS